MAIHTTANRIKGTSASGKVYIFGTEWIDDSIRFERVGDLLVVERRADDIWEPCSLAAGANTVWLGHEVGLSGIGHHLATESYDGHLHFHAHSEFNGDSGLSVQDAQILTGTTHTVRQLFQPDLSGEFTGTEVAWVMTSPYHLLNQYIYYNIGDTAATAHVLVEVFAGADDTGQVLFHKTFNKSLFVPNTEIRLAMAGWIEYEKDATYYVKISSDGVFSLKADVTNTYPWLAADITTVEEDNLLQTAPWIDGATYTAGQYFIDNRKIYVCKNTGVQNGTFAANASNWGLLSTSAVAPEMEVVNKSC